MAQSLLHFNVASCRPIRKESEHDVAVCRSRNGMTRGFRPSRRSLSISHAPATQRVTIAIASSPSSALSPRSHFISSSASKSASERGRSIRRSPPPPRIATTTETERLPFVRARKTRPPVAKCICRRNRPSVRHACSLLRFPPAATKRLGSPSLLCPSFLLSFPLFSASVFRLLAPRRQRPSPPPPPFDCPRDKNRAPLFACSAAM